MAEMGMPGIDGMPWPSKGISFNSEIGRWLKCTPRKAAPALSGFSPNVTSKERLASSPERCASQCCLVTRLHRADGVG